MTTPHPLPSRSPLTSPSDPQAVVEAFLDALADADLDRAGELLGADVVYVNVGLPSIPGRERVLRALRMFDRPSAAFEVYLHAISASGPTVLTERTDVITYRRWRSQFWVTGRFDVVDGQITLWRDAFDYLDLARAAVRGVAGAVIPKLRPVPPRTDGAPGRH